MYPINILVKLFLGKRGVGWSKYGYLSDIQNA